MLEGVMVYGHADSEYTMRPGDTLLLDGEGLHGPRDLVRRSHPHHRGNVDHAAAGALPKRAPARA
jgi:hypothetical protein